MPGLGDRCPRDCPDCGQPMYWSEAAVHDPDVLARRRPVMDSTIEYVDAYRCANGHTSQACPLCGGYDTAAWKDDDDRLHYHVICAACGHDSVVEA